MNRYRLVALLSDARILCEAAWDAEAVPWHLTIRPLQVYLSALEYIHKFVFHQAISIRSDATIVSVWYFAFRTFATYWLTIKRIA